MNLHIGGTQPKEGWKILNVQTGPTVDFVGDICDLSAFQDNSIETIYASHVLEHVSQAEVVPALQGINRALKPGGRFLVSVPDLDALCHLFIAPWATAEIKWHAMRMMFGGQMDPDDFHCIGLNEEFLRSFLAEAGFSKVQKVDSFGIFEDTSAFRPYGFSISLNLTATK
jgi:predicted SAM-dependent methyltransferase